MRIENLLNNINTNYYDILIRDKAGNNLCETDDKESILTNFGERIAESFFPVERDALYILVLA